VTATIARAAGHNIADYSLRVHIFQFNSHSHYYQRSLDMGDGEGRANVYENSEPRGFDFSYHCSDRLMVSPGYETYPARWKKPGQTIEVLQPVFGKPGAFESCELKVEMKESAYYKHNGLLNEEPAAVFKAWMEKREYDPEHGKTEPQPDTRTDTSACVRNRCCAWCCRTSVAISANLPGRHGFKPHSRSIFSSRRSRASFVSGSDTFGQVP
jgi:hypothetical protein